MAQDRNCLLPDTVADWTIQTFFYRRGTIYRASDNGLQHFACKLSMAKTSQPDTGGSQFFIMPDDINHHHWLDGVHTVFGEVTEGCEHITTISEVATGQNDRPIVPVIILSAEIV